jgi:dipeptidase
LSLTDDGAFCIALSQSNSWEYPLFSLYSGRRHWRVYDLLSPSLKLDSTLGWIPTIPTFPFSMKPEKAPLGPEDLMAILRDNYDGTQYDLSKGIKGGPFSSPLQFDPGHYNGITGGWER